MNTKKLFLINGVFTALGAVILFLFAGRLDSWLNLGHNSNFLWYLLGACSLSLAVLSFYAFTFKETFYVRAILATFLVFNGASALVGIWAIISGVNHLIWLNIIIHLTFFVAFLYYLLPQREGVPK